MAAAISCRLKFEPEMRKTVVCGVSVLDTEPSSCRHVSTLGGKPDWAIRRCHGALTKNSFCVGIRELTQQVNAGGKERTACARLRRGHASQAGAQNQWRKSYLARTECAGSQGLPRWM